MEEKLASVEKIHHKVKLGVSLESIVKFHNERTVDLLENISLRYRYMSDQNCDYYSF